MSLSHSCALQASPSGYLSRNRKQKRVRYNLLGAPLVFDLLLTGLPAGKTIFNKKRIPLDAEYYIENILHAGIILNFRNLKITHQYKMSYYRYKYTHIITLNIFENMISLNDIYLKL